MRLSRRLRPIFLQQRFKENQNDERQQEHEQQPALGPWFLLRILIFGQSLLTVLKLKRTPRAHRELFLAGVPITGS